MGSRKKFLIKTICFGEDGHLARAIIEDFQKKNGTKNLSEYIRKLVVIANQPPSPQAKIEALTWQYKQVKSEIALGIARKQGLEQELIALGANPDAIL